MTLNELNVFLNALKAAPQGELELSTLEPTSGKKLPTASPTAASEPITPAEVSPARRR
jgi:hypothetical protein